MLREWLRRWRGVEEAERISLSVPPAREKLALNEVPNFFGSLDMKGALEAHAAWKKRLREVIEGKARDIPEVGKVARDDLCALGQWLHGEANRMFNHGGPTTEQYHRLRDIHARFHLAAAETLSAHQSGDGKAAEAAERRANELSSKVQIELVRLFVEHRAATRK